MAAADATAYPVLNQAYRVYFVIKNLTTGNPLTGGLTGLSTSGNCQLSKDGAAWVNATNSPTEIGTSGYGFLDVIGAETNFSAVFVRISATNTNAIEWQALLLTGGVTQVQSGLATTTQLTSAQTAIIAAVPTVSNIWAQADGGDTAGRATTVLGQIAQIYRAFFNRGSVDKNAQTLAVYRDDSSTPMLTAPVTANSSVSSRNKAS